VPREMFCSVTDEMMTELLEVLCKEKSWNGLFD
jgi:hypothetical protein